MRMMVEVNVVEQGASGALRRVRQVGYVVRDLERAMSQWTDQLGVGPFFYIDHLPLREYIYAGAPSEPYVSGALSCSGDLQIELLSQRNDARSMWRAFLEAGHEGFHHVAYWTEEYDRDLAVLIRRGLEVGHCGRSGASGRFAYLVPDAEALPVVELSEIDAAKVAVFAFVAEAANTWDGSDPIRALSPPVPAPAVNDR